MAANVQRNHHFFPGVRMFAIGVGEAEEVELREIASRPTDEHTYNVADFAAISTIKDAFVRNVCESVDGAYTGTRALFLLNCCSIGRACVCTCS